MEANLGISLYSYLYLNLAKTIYLSYYLLCIPFNKIGEQESRSCSAGSRCGRERQREGEVVQTMYTRISKYKNHKIKLKRN
jgi:hypothetical protein